MADRIDIVALGYCSIDHVCRLPRLPAGDKVEAAELLIGGGGPAATAAVAAARLGARTAFVGAVGNDEPGRAIRAELAAEGVDLSGLAVRPGGRSPVAYCWIEAATGQRSIAWSRGTLRPLAADEAGESLIRGCRVLLLDGHQPEAALQAARWARESGAAVLLDAGTYRPPMDELMALSHVVVASEPFAGRFAPGRTPREAVSAILARGARWAAVTLGERGAVAGDGRRWAEQPAFRVPVVDTTGAGDVYHGAVAVGLLDGAAPDDILRFAAAAAALKCRALGGRLGIPGRAEVEAFLKSGGEGSGKSASSRPAGRPGGCAKEGTEGI